MVLFHTVPQKVWCVWLRKATPFESRHKSEVTRGPRLPGGAIATVGAAKSLSGHLAGPGKFDFLLFLPTFLPIKELDGRKENQLTPSKHFSGFNSILY